MRRLGRRFVFWVRDRELAGSDQMRRQAPVGVRGIVCVAVFKLVRNAGW